MRQYIKPSFAEIMDCRLISAKPLTQQIMANC